MALRRLFLWYISFCTEIYICKFNCFKKCDLFLIKIEEEKNSSNNRVVSSVPFKELPKLATEAQGDSTQALETTYCVEEKECEINKKVFFKSNYLFHTFRPYIILIYSLVKE
jgi:hypothetical protein